MPKQTSTQSELSSNSSNPAGLAPAIPWWTIAVVVIAALLLAVGGIIALVHPAMLVSPHDEINSAAHIYAGYLASRNLVLAALLFVTLFARAKAALSNLTVLTGFIQLTDAAMDCAEGRWPIVPGVIVLGAVLLLAAARLSGSPFWKRSAWG